MARPAPARTTDDQIRAALAEHRAACARFGSAPFADEVLRRYALNRGLLERVGQRSSVGRQNWRLTAAGEAFVLKEAA